MSLTFALLHAATPRLHLCTLCPAPVPEPEDPHLAPDRRDLRPEDAAKALKGKPDIGMYAAGMIHSQVPGLGLQVSGSGIQHQVQVRARTRPPNQKTRTWLPIAET